MGLDLYICVFACACVHAVAPPGFQFDPSTQTAVECENGFYSSSWDRSESCTPCGANPAANDDAVGWHSEGLLRLPVRDPNNGLTLRWISVRGNATSCCELLTWPVCVW